MSKAGHARMLMGKGQEPELRPPGAEDRLSGVQEKGVEDPAFELELGQAAGL